MALPKRKPRCRWTSPKSPAGSFFFDKVISPNEKSLALWLSGYYNAKRNNTVLDVGALAKNVDKVEDYCRMNLDVTVMDAVTKALGSGQ